MLSFCIVAAFAAAGGLAYLIVRGSQEEELPLRSLSAKGGLNAARSRDNQEG